MVDFKADFPVPSSPLGSATVDEIEVLAALLREKSNMISNSPTCFPNIQKLVDLEIWRIRQNLFQSEFKCDLVLPETEGPIGLETDKFFLPKKEMPDFNFVGRIIGPRGVTSKQIEFATGCKIMIRGKGSCRLSPRRRNSRSSDKEEEDLHVIIQCEDSIDRARIRIEKAKELITQIIDPDVKGDNDLKKRQLLELAILNGSYRERTPSTNRSNPSTPNKSPSIGRRNYSRNSSTQSPCSPVGSPISSLWNPPHRAVNRSPSDEELGWIWKELRMNANPSSCLASARNMGGFPYCANNVFRAESNYGR